MKDFRVTENKVEEIIREYKINNYKKSVFNDCDTDDKQVLMVEFALSQLKGEEKRIFENDFLLDDIDKYWGSDYYSKSTYYRHKYKAMQTFLHCFKL